MAAGELAFLTGHSGAGKSTLLKLIGLLERASTGQVWVNGRNLNRLRNRDIPFHRREVGMIFQDHRLLHDRTVFDNVALPLVVAGLGHTEVQRRVRAALDKVGLLDKEKVFPVTLSGGEQQRVGIARAIVTDPTLLLCDEPTGDLDRKSGDEVLNLLQALNREQGKTIVMVTHDMHAAERAGRTLYLDKGQLSTEPSV
jgi:cell division transport system ATP-binding protein